jgi:PIN domain nuclease of toxin-antitoxin system
VRLLLDTEVLLCALGARKLPKEAKRLIKASQVFVSAVSIWEVAVKASLGQLGFSAELVREAIEPSGFEELPVTAAHAAAVERLPRLRGDPFDRLLVAQATVEPLILLTTDAALAPYGPLIRVL